MPSWSSQQGGGLTRASTSTSSAASPSGRSADADVRLDDRYASGFHARVFSRSGAYFVEDLNSTNGTLLNSQELHGEAELRPGDVIRIGDTEFRFEVS